MDLSLDCPHSEVGERGALGSLTFLSEGALHFLDDRPDVLRAGNRKADVLIDGDRPARPAGELTSLGGREDRP